MLKWKIKFPDSFFFFNGFLGLSIHILLLGRAYMWPHLYNYPALQKMRHLWGLNALLSCTWYKHQYKFCLIWWRNPEHIHWIFYETDHAVCWKVQSDVHQEPIGVQGKNCVLIFLDILFLLTRKNSLYVRHLRRELPKWVATNLSDTKIKVK